MTRLLGGLIAGCACFAVLLFLSGVDPATILGIALLGLLCGFFIGFMAAIGVG